MTNNDMLKRLVTWANRRDEIRALIIDGSLAAEYRSDEYSDIDLVVFCTDLQSFENDVWMDEIGKVWTEEGWEGEIGRMVVFEGAVKVDFTFKLMTDLHELVAADPLPDKYNLGYEILLDKDGLTANMVQPKHTGFLLTKPQETTFLRDVRHFWTAVSTAAKYIRRGDLWHARLRDWEAKRCLLQMIEWHECAEHDWNYMIGYTGKRMSSWVSRSIWISVRQMFNTADSWDALFETFRLYSRLARETADMLGYLYPKVADENITKYALKLRQDSRQLSDSPDS